MHFLVETIDQLNNLPIEQECFLQIIPDSYSYHPKLIKPSLFYYRNSQKGYIICQDHSESFSIKNQDILEFINSHKRVYVLDRKFHSYFLESKNLIDLLFLSRQEGALKNIEDFKTQIQKDYESKYFGFKDVNKIIPITKHYEHLENLYDYFKQYKNFKNRYEDFNKVCDAYHYVETFPIGVKKCFFDTYTLQNESFSVEGKSIYTHYNLYNLTGRPTNTFNGVNFLAIPKDKIHRECIIPKNDYLVEYDFDGYHVRLIANQMNYKLPETSVHEYFAKLYFNKEHISDEDYKASKIITFRQLYGGVEDQYMHIEFFQKMKNFMEELDHRYIDQGYLTLPTGVSILKNKDITKPKLFNYYVQNLETKVNSDKILKIKNILSENRTHLCLITYDAFLFDFDKSDGKDLLLRIKEAMEEGGYKTKHKHGTSYIL